jgi:predicted phosphodiesterase
MRLAILSDVHGNTVGLDAVLADVQARGGADGFLVLGDLAALGPDPVGALERLAALPGARLVRGNTDRYLVTGERPPPTPAEVRADPGLLPQYTDVAQTLSWSQGCVAAAGWLDWLAALPGEVRLTLPDGTRLLGVHAAPGRDDGPGVTPVLDDGTLASYLAGAGAELVCVGHTHWPLDRAAGGVRVVNAGSVGNPVVPGGAATYAFLEADARGYRVEAREVPFDRAAVVAALRRARHPAPDWIAAHYLGRHRPPWAASGAGDALAGEPPKEPPTAPPPRS